MSPEETYGILLAPSATVAPGFKTVCLHPVIAARQAEGVANIVNGISVATKNFLSEKYFCADDGLGLRREAQGQIGK